jgi:hypothetical protein
MAFGRKTGGGSRKGIPNKAVAAREAEVKASGLTPLDFMLGQMRDPDAPIERRMWAANAAAPYVHPRLASLDSKHSGSLSLEALVLEAVKLRGGA